MEQAGPSWNGPYMEKESMQSQMNDGKDAGENKKSPGKGKKVAITTAAVACGLAVAAGGAYTYLSGQYKSVFFPNTVINGLDASGKTVAQVKEMIDSSMVAYTLELEGRDGGKEEINGGQIGLHPEYDGSLENLLASQEPMRWGLHFIEGASHTIETMVVYDRDKLQDAIDGLDCMDRDKAQAPADAYLSEYQPGQGFVVMPEQPGTVVDPEKMMEAVSDAILNLQDGISLAEKDVYEKAKITSKDPKLQEEAKRWNYYTDVTVKYHFGDQEEVLDGDTTHTWVKEDDEGNLVLDEEKVAEYVAKLAETYDTASKPKNFKTSYGDMVTINKGTYGWRINQSAEAAALSEIIRSGVSQEREPVYSQNGASCGDYDYGYTYLEIKLTAHHLYFYVNGALVVESDFVSGNEARGFTTPAGVYPLTYKQRNAVLRGPGYASPVSFWMPFNGGIGLHDASWRGAFGGRIYKTNGSHGCINLPRSAAQSIFESISAGDPVLCYRLDGTDNGKTSAPKSNAPAAVPAAAPPAPAPVQPEPTIAANPEGEGAPAETPVGETPAEGGENTQPAIPGEGSGSTENPGPAYSVTEPPQTDGPANMVPETPAPAPEAQEPAPEAQPEPQEPAPEVQPEPQEPAPEAQPEHQEPAPETAAASPENHGGDAQVSLEGPGEGAGQ